MLTLEGIFVQLAFMTNIKKALVLFSGGQDSTVCLFYALKKYDYVETIGFDYGQRHKVELKCRDNIIRIIKEQFSHWGDRIKDDHCLPLPALKLIGGTSLTEDSAFYLSENGLPSTFVPARNLLFLTYAAALAYRRDIDVLITGMCETDYSGYPDCRRKTLDSLEHSIMLGMEKKVTIETPLMEIDKKNTWQFAQELGGEKLINIIIEHTHSCYRGERRYLYAWGYGCNDCFACNLRSNGYQRWINTNGL